MTKAWFLILPLMLANTASVPAAAPQLPSITGDIAKAIPETGRIFQSGGIDGLVLFALILGTVLMFFALCFITWAWRSSTIEVAKLAAKAEEATSDAAKEMADALRDAATAIAAGSSANLTFQQTVANLLERTERILFRMEAPRV